MPFFDSFKGRVRVADRVAGADRSMRRMRPPGLRQGPGLPRSQEFRERLPCGKKVVMLQRPSGHRSAPYPARSEWGRAQICSRTRRNVDKERLTHRARIRHSRGYPVPSLLGRGFSRAASQGPSLLSRIRHAYHPSLVPLALQKLEVHLRKTFPKQRNSFAQQNGNDRERDLVDEFVSEQLTGEIAAPA